VAPVVSAATAVAAVDAFAAVAAFVAGGAALAAAFSHQKRFVSPVADLPSPAAALLSAARFLAARIAFAVAAGTSGLASGCLYLERWAVAQPEGREHALACWAAHRYSPDAELPHFRHDWPEACNVPLPLEPARGRGL